MSKKLLIKGGRVIDPASKMDGMYDILIEEEKIIKISESIDSTDEEVIQLQGELVVPGLIDMHVHFREPGREDVETIVGGSKVAARGGFTSVCTMPNTVPVIDNQSLVRFIKMEAEKGPINVFPVASITSGSKGEELSEMGELLQAGAIAFSDDGVPVCDSRIMRRALEYSKMFDVPLLTHAEDLELTDNGIMHEGVNSTLLGLKGIPSEAEEVMIARDILLSRLTSGRVHVCHVSSDGAVDLIRRAKQDGISITSEVAPHHFSLTDDAVEEHQSMAKMKPPLRTEFDRLALIEGLRDGSIDVIATDHAPHSSHEKKQEMEYAPFGIVGLETAVPLMITKLARENDFSYLELFEKVTSNPAKILKLENRGVLNEGSFADITIIDPEAKVTVDENLISSKCKNTPFFGEELFGKVLYTICNGKVVFNS